MHLHNFSKIYSTDLYEWADKPEQYILVCCVLLNEHNVGIVVRKEKTLNPDVVKGKNPYISNFLFEIMTFHISAFALVVKKLSCKFRT